MDLLDESYCQVVLGSFKKKQIKYFNTLKCIFQLSAFFIVKIFLSPYFGIDKNGSVNVEHLKSFYRKS